jgi:antitoxin ParD1/3/4
MSTLNVSLPDAMKRFVEAQVGSGLYSSASDYVRALIRVEQQRCAEATVAATLLHGVDQDAVASLPPAVWAWLQTRLGSPAARRRGGDPSTEKGGS